MKIDLESAPTMSLTRGNEHERMALLAGAWSGVARTWLEPGKPPLEEAFKGTAKLLLGGRFLRLAYTTSLNRTPIAGELTLGFERDEGRWATAWIDSFHTGSAILVSQGVPRESQISVFGEYYVKGVPQRWGWRTVIEDVGGLVIRMYNVTPERQETPGVEIVLGRKPKGAKAPRPSKARRRKR